MDSVVEIESVLQDPPSLQCPFTLPIVWFSVMRLWKSLKPTPTQALIIILARLLFRPYYANQRQSLILDSTPWIQDSRHYTLDTLLIPVVV